MQAQRRGREGWKKRITIDLDQTPTPTYGGQQLTFSNGSYHTYCYIPLVAAISSAGEPDHKNIKDHAGVMLRMIKAGEMPEDLGGGGEEPLDDFD